MDEIAQECIRAISAAKGIPAEGITTASTFEELALDSLDRVSLSFDLEEKYNVDIPEHRLNSIKTVGDVVNEVHQAILRTSRPAAETPTP